MSDEQAFWEQIAATPTDQSVRLLYADWLEEQGRGLYAEFLRVECQWFTRTEPLDYQPAHDEPAAAETVRRYPQPLQQLSELATHLAWPWLVEVSWLGWEINQSVKKLAVAIPGLNLSRTNLNQTNRLVIAQEAIVHLEQHFTNWFGTTISKRFLMPIDYLLFCLLIDGLVCPEKFGMTYFDELYDVETMTQMTWQFCNMYYDDNGHALSNNGLWLFVGNRNRHDFHISCDRQRHLFGCVIDEHDTHPWQIALAHPNWEEGQESVCDSSFLDYLHRQLQKIK